MKKQLILLLFVFVVQSISAQIQDAWIFFKDKPSQSVYMNAPLTMLTQRSLERREQQNISLDIKDIPIESDYIMQIKNSLGITILAKSKWLNALHLQGSFEDIVNLENLNFVDSIEFANKLLNTSEKITADNKIVQRKNKLDFQTDFNYGQAENQIKILKGEVLHENNFTGEGMQIAVMDAGFPNVNTFHAFERIRNNNQILGGYDFVNRNSNFYTGSNHGMSVLSTIAGYIENEFVGTAPDADFYLFITEDSNNEVPLEESLWVEAAEKADSLGVDVINTSLGYTTFDNPTYNYSYDDMDGATAYITRGAEIAFSRGMIVVNSAGNSGDDAWKYISAPADAPSVLSIGAVDRFGSIANFSSFGPSKDGRIKPDVCAQGADVYIINSSGQIATSNGTSFSSPVLTGVITCLWQSNPEKTNNEIVQLVKESSHYYGSPRDQEGYGIPNFKSIYDLLYDNEPEEIVENIIAFPNPIDTTIYFKFPLDVFEIEVVFMNTLGQVIFSDFVQEDEKELDISFLNSGLYFMQIVANENMKTNKVIKK